MVKWDEDEEDEGLNTDSADKPRLLGMRIPLL